ncbi:MAG TPA: glycine cleavage T C-terminal barrel domain-containing protein [Vicinamibacterales bacterium]|nr:glycine cleavage T C-terminal barrel domain-containing protein [Vicinamibacterales bacterium]
MTLTLDYETLAAAAGLLDDTGLRGRLLVAGADRRRFLQGLLTNDIEALGPGTGCYAALLTPQGRMTTDLRVSELGDACLLDLPASRAPVVAARLEDSIFTEDVTIRDATAEQVQFAVHGPRAFEIVSRALAGAGVEAVPSEAQLAALREYHHTLLRLAGTPLVVARADDLAVPGLVLYAAREHRSLLWEALSTAGARPVSREAAEALRIEAGRPAFGADMDEHTIPLEAGIERRAISFTKGCYVGQEVIIRVLHRGHGRVARRLVRLDLETEGPEALPPRGAPLRLDGREVGRLTSVAWSPRRGGVALGYVQRDHAVAGSILWYTEDTDTKRAVSTEKTAGTDTNGGTAPEPPGGAGPTGRPDGLAADSLAAAAAREGAPRRGRARIRSVIGMEEES